MRPRLPRTLPRLVALALFPLSAGLCGCTNLRYVETRDLWSRSDQAFDSGSYGDTISYYDELIRRDPEDAQAYLMRGAAHERTGDVREAGRDYRKAADLGETRGLFFSANLNIVTGNTGAAEDDLTRLRDLPLGPRDRTIQLTLLGTLRLRQGEYRMAAQNLERAIESGRGQYDAARHVRDAHYNASEAYYQLGDFQRAYEHYAAYAGVSEGESADGSLGGEDHYMLGLLAYLAGDFAEADAHLAHADPDLVADAAKVLDDPSFGAGRREGLK